jgi:hypothetical protein
MLAASKVTGLRRSAVALGLALLSPSVGRAQAPAIDHKAVGCIVAERFPRFDACFAPAEEVARARVYFRTHGTPHWYFVDMKAEAACHAGLLPKPKKTTRQIDYYIDVVDRRFAEGRTREHDPRVVDGPGGCRKDMMMAAAMGAGSIVLGAVAGAPPIPVGFESEGILGALGAGGGGSGGGPAAASGGGGGGGTVAAFVLGAGAAGGAVYYLTQRDKEDAPGAPVYDGEWSGTTSQGRVFTFTVAQNTVVRIDSSYQLTTGSVPVVVPVQRTFSPGLPIANGGFTFQDQAVVLTGTFASERSSSGRLEPTRATPLTWQATRR